MFKNTGRHVALPRESRGRVRRVVKAAAVALGIAATLAAGIGSGPAGTPWLPGQAIDAMHAAAHLRPAMSASAPAGPARPVWDGRGTYPDDGIEPLCPSVDAGHVATVGTGPHAFRVTCAVDGREYAWSVRP